MVKAIIVYLYYSNLWGKNIGQHDIHKVTGIFDLRESSISEFNHESVKRFVINNSDGIHRSMQQLMKR